MTETNVVDPVQQALEIVQMAAAKGRSDKGILIRNTEVTCPFCGTQRGKAQRVAEHFKGEFKCRRMPAEAAAILDRAYAEPVTA